MLPSQNCRNEYDSDSNLDDISEKFNIIQFSELDENESDQIRKWNFKYICLALTNWAVGVRNRSTSQHKYLKWTIENRKDQSQTTIQDSYNSRLFKNEL